MPRSFQTSGRSSFLMPSRSIRWPPVSFTIGTLYFTATCAMRISSSARGHAAVDARHDGERAVLLDVGVDAVVDEARVALVVVFAGPQRFQQRREADLAGGIFLAVRPVARKTSLTDLMPRLLISATSCDFSSGTPGT